MIMSYNPKHDVASDACVMFDFGESLSHLDCRSMALNDHENYLILVGHHELKLIHFDELTYSMINNITDEQSMIIPYESNLQTIPLFNPCNVNRPILQWNHHNSKQFALAVDRLVRFYSIEDGAIQETDTIINTQHQRPISTISYWPYDPHALLTGSFDGQIQLWDIRHCSSKSPANLKIIIPTPFTVRRIQWPSIAIDHRNSSSIDTNQLAIQCDRCVRVYDMRRPDTYLSSIEHQQRVISIDWTQQKQAIVTHSADNTLKLFSPYGQMLAESLVNEMTNSFTISKVRTTAFDNLLITAVRDVMSSTYGFLGWRWDEDQHLRPVSEQILTTTSSAIVDFTLLKSSKFNTLFQQIATARSNNSVLERLPILVWCQDEKLRLIEMDLNFRQTYHELTRMKLRAQAQAQALAKFPQLSRIHRRSSISKTMMDVIEDETSRSEESDCGDISLHDLSSSRNLSIDSSETGDDNDNSFSSDHSLHLPSTVSIPNEFNSIQDTYGPYIAIETKDEQRRLCVLRCLYPLDNRKSFRIYLFLSRHYPIVSQLSVRFKLSAQYNCDEKLKTFQRRIQAILDETSSQCFYHGQLCLHQCLFKLKLFFQAFLRKEQHSTHRRLKKSKKKRHRSSHSMDLDISFDYSHNKGKIGTSFSVHAMFDISFSSPRQQNDQTQLSSTPSIRANPRPCGARFAGGNYLICFGRSIALQTEPVSAPPILNTSDGKFSRRTNPFHMRSTSLSVPKSRQSFTVDEQMPSYRSSINSTKNVQIQNHSSRRRTSMSSAPVCFSLGSSVERDPQRISSTSSVSFHRPHSTNPSTSNANVSIYDLSILLPVSKKLADEYKINLDDPLEMCDANQQLTEKLAKDDLAHCWHLLRGLLQLQSTLPADHSWFETPIAHGLIEYLVSRYVAEGDIQSASMFLLTMLKTPYMKSKLSFNSSSSDQSFHPILYAYASILHRWKHFYKRTQVFQEVNAQCSSTSIINPSGSSSPSNHLTCSLCSQPIRGQHFLCSICGHAGHLIHIHQWFSSSNLKHRYCPEKDCTCRCMIKQQELLTSYNSQLQQHQHTPTVSTPRSHSFRQIASGNAAMSVRP